MRLEQQMNYACDKEASKAVERSIQHKFFTKEKQLCTTREGWSSICWRQKAHKQFKQGNTTGGKQRKGQRVLNQRVQMVIRAV